MRELIPWIWLSLDQPHFKFNFRIIRAQNFYNPVHYIVNFSQFLFSYTLLIIHVLLSYFLSNEALFLPYSFPTHKTPDKKCWKMTISSFSSFEFVCPSHREHDVRTWNIWRYSLSIQFSLIHLISMIAACQPLSLKGFLIFEFAPHHFEVEIFPPSNPSIKTLIQ